jgi:eukaryotic-like serine/threonine-protein kinase
MRACAWVDCAAGESILRPGEMDDRFYVVVSGRVRVSRDGNEVGGIETGGCFGEAAYGEGPRRDSTITADSPVTLLKVTATLLEQTSIACQLRFNKVFLRELIERLQRGRKSE